MLSSCVDDSIAVGMVALAHGALPLAYLLCVG
jgi:hypothetical protein